MSRRSIQHPKRHRTYTFLSLSILCLSVAALTSNLIAIRTTKDRVLAQPIASQPPYDCILIFGAGLNSDGTPCLMLRDRLDTAAESYRRGMAPVLIVSGDKHEGYDEPGAMLEYLLKVQGIPEMDVIMDAAGFSTWDSVRNINGMGCKRIVVVTQRYHLHRAMRAADRMGLDCVGVDATGEGRDGTVWMKCREVLARTVYEMCYVVKE